MKLTDEMIEAAALSDAEFDGRNFVCMGRVDRDRYMLRAKASLTASLSASPAGVGVESENRLLEKLKVSRGIFAMQNEQYTSRALHNIITEFEAERAARSLMSKIGERNGE